MRHYYTTHLLPWLLNRSMATPALREARARVVGQARGTVLEIGFGAGHNLPYYHNINQLIALEPSRELITYAATKIANAPFPVKILRAPAEGIPLPDHSVDTVVSTWTLCSVTDVAVVLKEIRRVLVPTGMFVFIEHGQTPHWLPAVLQKVLTPLTRRCAGNCHLDRNIHEQLVAAGFTVVSLTTGAPPSRPLAFMYEGSAMVAARDTLNPT